MKILHIVNSFDPSADVVRCVRELNKYSRHSHKIFVQQTHPCAEYEFEQAEGVGSAALREQLLKECDAILYQFTGHEGFPDDPRKPAAFRNINIYWDKAKDQFWSHPTYNARSFGRYSQVASSHAGAAEFLPKNFTWLPDLLPQDGLYMPNRSIIRKPCVSFIKHADELSRMDFPGGKQNLDRSPHAHVLLSRRVSTVVIDNVCDGHWGLAGHEAVLMGLPVIVFNHPKTIEALNNLTGTNLIPFLSVAPTVEAAAEEARDLMRNPQLADIIGLRGRMLAEKYFHSKFLIEKTWDPFFDRLVRL